MAVYGSDAKKMFYSKSQLIPARFRLNLSELILKFDRQSKSPKILGWKLFFKEKKFLFTLNITTKWCEKHYDSVYESPYRLFIKFKAESENWRKKIF